MKQRKIVTASALILACSWSVAMAGVAIKIKEKTMRYEGAESSTQVFLDQNFAKIETQNEDGKSAIIFDKAKEIAYFIDLRDNTVMTMTKEQARQMGKQMSDQMSQVQSQMAQAQKMMEEQLKTMPPEKRKLVEEMMKKQMGAGRIPADMPQMAEAETTEYKKVASNVTIGQWSTDHYVGTQGEEKVEEVWTASPDKLGMKPQDVQIMYDLRNFMQEVVGEFGKAMNTQMGNVLGDEKYEGLPVKKVSYDGDEATSETLVEEIVKQDFAKGFFDLPKNLKPKKMFQMQE